MAYKVSHTGTYVGGGGSVRGFKHPSSDLIFFLPYFLLACLSERSVMYEDTPTTWSGKLDSTVFRGRKVLEYVCYTHIEWNQNFIIALSYVLYMSSKITEFEI